MTETSALSSRSPFPRGCVCLRSAKHSLVRTRDLIFHSLMKVANVADLRSDFHKVAASFAEGESVTVKMRGKAFALLTPPRGADGPPMAKIDFAAQLKRIWGDKVFSDDEIRQMKEAELEGQEG
jgi:antitoxin (DNA-binding transcriptional repressor) of toxin-antitoxin stability system